MLGCMMSWCHSFCHGLHLVLLGAVDGFPRWVRHTCVAATSTSCIAVHGGWLGGGTRYRSQCSQWCRGWPLAHSKHHLGDVDVLDLKALMQFWSNQIKVQESLTSFSWWRPSKHGPLQPHETCPGETTLRSTLLNPHIYQLQCGTPKSYVYWFLSFLNTKTTTSKMQPLSGNQRPDLEHVSCTAPATENASCQRIHMSHACHRFSTCYKPLTFCSLWQGAQSLAPATQNDIWTSKSDPNPSVFTLLTWKCASRHDSVRKT